MSTAIKEIASRIEAQEALQSYDTAKVYVERLYSAMNKASAVLEKFPKGNMGLTPDHVKITNEYQKAKADFDKAFAELRAFNTVYVKKFKKERLKDRSQKLSIKSSLNEDILMGAALLAQDKLNTFKDDEGKFTEKTKSKSAYKDAEEKRDVAFAELRDFYKRTGIVSRKVRAWTDNVETTWSPPEGFFKQTPDKIAHGLKAAHPSLQSAMGSLNFYINRAGKNLDHAAKQRLHMAQDKLKSLYLDKANK